MKKFIFNKDKYATFSKKISSFCIDFIIVLIFGCLFAYGSVNINKSLDSYKESANLVDKKISLLNQYTFEAKLSDIDSEGNIVSTNDMYKKYAISHILLSYDNNIEYFAANGINNLHENSNIKDKYVSISVNTDSLAYFYCVYLPNLTGEVNQPDYKGLTPYEYYKNIIKDNTNDYSMFDFADEYPTLKPEFAVGLYSYIIEEKTSDNTTGKTNNTKLSSIYTNVLNASAKTISQLTFFQKEYVVYKNNYNKLVSYVNIDLLIGFSLSFVLFIGLMPLIFKNGRTLGKVLTKLVVADIRNKNCSYGNLCIRFILNYLLYFPAIFIIAFLTTGTNAVILPIFYIGSFGVSMVLFISIALIFGIADAIVSYIKRDHRSLIDLASSSIILLTDELNEELPKETSPNKM